MVNFLSKFISNASKINAQLREIEEMKSIAVKSIAGLR